MNITDYASFQDATSSEKIVLAVIHASRRLMGWSLYSGSIYSFANIDVASIVGLEDSGTAYTEVSALADVVASTFYNDRINKILYVRTAGSDSPNTRFMVLTQKMFFSTAPIVLPEDLDAGTEVFWEPMIQATSTFGVEIDTIKQTSDSIEGSGSLTLINDGTLWPAIFDKYFFENQACYIYSTTRDIAASEAELLFQGFIEKKSYSASKIQFSLKDILADLKTPIPLDSIDDLSLRSSIPNAKQRMVLGRKFGHRPTNVDEVLEGYPLAGTVSINIGATTVSGSGTSFLAHFSPDDKIVLDGNECTVGSVTSNTSLDLSAAYDGDSNVFAASFSIIPDRPKRDMNRVWSVAGHELRQPVTTVNSGTTTSKLVLQSTADMYAGDTIYIGAYGTSGRVIIDEVVSDKIVNLSASLTTIPPVGTTVFKPCIQHLRMNNLELVYERDYYIEATTGLLTINSTAESSIGPVTKLPNNLTFTNLSRVVTGTALKSSVYPGALISCVGQTLFYEVLSVDSETQLTLRTTAGFTATAGGLVKAFIFDPEKDVLTCEVFGRTVDGTTFGPLASTAPQIVKLLLGDLVDADLIDDDSFDDAEDATEAALGLVLPSTFDSTATPTYRDVINQVNRSVFGALIQNRLFKLSYLLLEVNKPADAQVFSEPDILSFSISSTSENMIKTAIVQYKDQEYDYTKAGPAFQTQQKTGDIANYIFKTERSKTFNTALIDSTDAERYANRWAFLLEYTATSIKFKTKMQGMRLDIGDIIEVSHRKIPERWGSDGQRKLMLIENIKKNGSMVEVEAVDLSNSFNRVASVMDSSTTWAESDEDDRLYGGYVSDATGLIDNDPDSFSINLIW